MKLIPAIDILDGKVTRLLQGDYDKASYYSHSPADIARNFAANGYSHLHIIDLSGAKIGSPQILQELKNIIALGLDVQVGGGIRTVDNARQYIDIGVKQLIIGTQALIHPKFIDELISSFHANTIIVSLDVRNGKIAIHGWLQEHEKTMTEVLQQLVEQGVRKVIITDITKDGTLSEVNSELYVPFIKSFPTLEIYAAGGVTTPNDIEELKRIGISGAIIGKAFYEQVLNGIQLGIRS